MATGVRTGNFTLAIAAQPTAALGETGHQSTSDDGYDAEANSTVDLGFDPLSGASAPLAGVVRRDLSQSGTMPLPGVEVALYADANSNGSLDTPEMLAVQSVVTDDRGGYAFEPVLPGDYLVVQSVLPGAEATFDTDGGAADVTRVTLEGEGITGVDFHQALVEATFRLNGSRRTRCRVATRCMTTRTAISMTTCWSIRWAQPLTRARQRSASTWKPTLAGALTPCWCAAAPVMRMWPMSWSLRPPARRGRRSMLRP